MPLTDLASRNAKPEAKPRKLADDKELFLLVHPNGSKYWRLKYRFGGKEKVLANDIDSGEHRNVQKAAREERAANSFEAIAREWFAKHMTNKTDTLERGNREGNNTPGFVARPCGTPERFGARGGRC